MYERVLVEAIKEDHKEIVKLLLKDSRVDPTVNDNFVIKELCYRGEIELIDLIKVDPRVKLGQQELAIACNKYGNITVVKKLMNEFNIIPSVRSLRNACWSKDNEIVRLFLKEPTLEKSKKLLFLDACESGNTEIVELLLKVVDPTLEDNSGLMYACNYNYIDIVKLLLADNRIDPNEYPEDCGGSDEYEIYAEPIRLACWVGNIDIVKLLLEDSRVDLSSRHDTLEISCRKGYIDIVRLILADSRIDPSLHNNFALKLAKKENHTEIVNLLLSDPRVKAVDDSV